MDLCDRNDLQGLLARHGFHFSKTMGQNFLIDGRIPAQIAEASRADAQSGVLEIGPGVGCLSRELCRRAGKVASVELDERLYPVLEETMAPYTNFTLVRGDALALDLAKLAQESFPDLRIILCANLPYNVATPLLSKCASSRAFESMTVLIQKEVAQRICAAPGTPDYGFFSLSIEDAQAVDVALFAVTAHQLQADADAQHRLTKAHNKLVEAVFAQVGHRRGSLSHPGKYHLVGTADQVGRVGHHRLHTQAAERMPHREDVSCVVFDDGYFHFDKI